MTVTVMAAARTFAADIIKEQRMWSTRLSWQIWWPCAVAVGLLCIPWGIMVIRWHDRTLEQAATQSLQQTASRLSAAWPTFSVGSDVERSQQLLQEARPWLSGEIQIMLVSPEGKVLADSSSSLLTPNTEVTAPIHDPSPRGVTRVKRATANGPRDYWVWTQDLPNHSGSGILIQLATPVEAWRAQFRTLPRHIGTAVPVLLLATLLVLAWQLDRQIRPIQRLTSTAIRISQGTLDDPLQLTDGNELQDLARTLNELQGRLARGALELQASGIQQETVLSAMTDGVLAVDCHETILFANTAVQTLLDLPAPPTVGRSLLESVRIHHIHQLLTRALRTGESQDDILELDTAIPRTLQVRATCMPGLPCPGTVIVLHDLSDARRLERLRQEFVANVSHELKTPLSSIKAYAETLRSGAIHDEANSLKFLGRIEEHADRLDSLIADLLRLARIESGQKSFEIGSVQVANLVQSRLVDHQASADTKQIVLSASGSDPTLHVRADDEGLRQILDNLITNAIKYTPEHGRVALRWFRNGGYVAIEVEDTGIGIAPEDQKRVFERFFRVDKARSRELGGTGLGLAIVKHLVQFFQGKVYVRSELGAGSIFGVLLPITERKDPLP